jgi:uncharacterized membrane protein
VKKLLPLYNSLFPASYSQKQAAAATGSSSLSVFAVNGGGFSFYYLLLTIYLILSQKRTEAKISHKGAKIHKES